MSRKISWTTDCMTDSIISSATRISHPKEARATSQSKRHSLTSIRTVVGENKWKRITMHHHISAGSELKLSWMDELIACINCIAWRSLPIKKGKGTANKNREFGQQRKLFQIYRFIILWISWAEWEVIWNRGWIQFWPFPFPNIFLEDTLGLFFIPIQLLIG